LHAFEARPKIAIIMTISRPPTPKDFTIAEARNRLPAIVHAVEAGSPVRLTRWGKPVAMLISLEEYERLRPRRPDLWGAIADFRKRTDLSDLDVDEIFGGVRDASPGREVEL
jgi:antitoxin Phd